MQVERARLAVDFVSHGSEAWLWCAFSDLGPESGINELLDHLSLVLLSESPFKDCFLEKWPPLDPVIVEVSVSQRNTDVCAQVEPTLRRNRTLWKLIHGVSCLEESAQGGLVLLLITKQEDEDG